MRTFAAFAEITRETLGGGADRQQGPHPDPGPGWLTLSGISEIGFDELIDRMHPRTRVERGRAEREAFDHGLETRRSRRCFRGGYGLPRPRGHVLQRFKSLVGGLTRFQVPVLFTRHGDLLSSGDGKKVGGASYRPITGLQNAATAVMRFTREREACHGTALEGFDGWTEDIAEAAFGLDDLRRAGIGLQLATEPQHLHIDAAVEDILVDPGGL